MTCMMTCGLSNVWPLFAIFIYLQSNQDTVWYITWMWYIYIYALATMSKHFWSHIIHWHTCRCGHMVGEDIPIYFFLPKHAQITVLFIVTLSSLPVTLWMWPFTRMLSTCLWSMILYKQNEHLQTADHAMRELIAHIYISICKMQKKAVLLRQSKPLPTADPLYLQTYSGRTTSLETDLQARQPLCLHEFSIKILHLQT